MGASYGFVKFTDRRCATVALQYLNVRERLCVWGGACGGVGVRLRVRM